MTTARDLIKYGLLFGTIFPTLISPASATLREALDALNERDYTFAAEILRLAHKQGVEKDGKIYISPIPVHSDIAARISTVRETVARTMSDLAKQGIVTRENGALVVHDVRRLEQLVRNVRGGDMTEKES